MKLQHWVETEQFADNRLATEVPTKPTPSAQTQITPPEPKENQSEVMNQFLAVANEQGIAEPKQIATVLKSLDRDVGEEE